jgi:hypothetical protein
MGDNFQISIQETAKGVQSPWRILQPPTGTGKTQGACVYAAMQAKGRRCYRKRRTIMPMLSRTSIRPGGSLNAATGFNGFFSGAVRQKSHLETIGELGAIAGRRRR